MTDLLPCPFCGHDDLNECFDGALGWIECPNCSAEGPLCEYGERSVTLKEAAEAWNRRPAAALAARVAPIHLSSKQGEPE